MGLVDVERSTYSEMWAVDAYAKNSPGEQLVPIFLDMAQPSLTDRVLDAGCGQGRGAVALQASGFDAIECCDLVDVRVLEARGFVFHERCLWRPLHLTTDWVYCCDVLEHVPESLTMLAVHQLLQSAERGVFLNISTVPDVHGAWVGRPLHQTVRPFTWWRDQLAEISHVVEARDFLTSAAFLVQHEASDAE